MAAAKKSSSTTKKTSSGSDSKSKAIVKKKMETVMHEFKEGELNSGNSAKKVRNPKQAIAIGLSEARRAGAKIPPSPNQSKGSGANKAAGKKTAAKTKSGAKRSPAKKR
jgi:hypothetical protein